VRDTIAAPIDSGCYSVPSAEQAAESCSATAGSEVFQDAVSFTGPATHGSLNLPPITEEELDGAAAASILADAENTFRNHVYENLPIKGMDVSVIVHREDVELPAEQPVAETTGNQSCGTGSEGAVGGSSPQVSYSDTGVSSDMVSEVGLATVVETDHTVVDLECGSSTVMSSSLFPTHWFSTPISSHAPPSLMVSDEGVRTLTLRRSEVCLTKYGKRSRIVLIRLRLQKFIHGVVKQAKSFTSDAEFCSKKFNEICLNFRYFE
jgi:hypothetical protein